MNSKRDKKEEKKKKKAKKPLKKKPIAKGRAKKPIEEKPIEEERAKKVRLLDRIDNLRVVQNNNFLIGKLEDAISVATEIKMLAKEAKLPTIVEEQEEFIDNTRAKIIEKNKISLFKDAFDVVKDDFEKLVANNKIVDAHKIVIDFKQKFENIFNLPSIATAIREFISKEEDLWNNFIAEQEKIKQQLKNLNTQFKRALKKADLKNMNEIITNAKELLANIFDEEIEAKWQSNEDEYLNYKREKELSEKIEKALEESKNLKEKFLFQEGMLAIDKAIKLIINEDMPEYKELLTETRQDLIAAETKYNKLYLNLAEYKEKLRKNQENNFLNAALSNCERIIHISQLIGMGEVKKEYQQVLKQIELEISEKKSATQRELEILTEKVKEIEKVIKIDEDISPIVEDFSVKDLLGDLADDILEKLEQLGTLLNEHRVDVKKNIINKVISTTSSGEIMEEEIPREALKSGGENEELIYQVRSGFTNRLEDTIDKAIITDLIPYNFEIIEVRFNGKLVKDLKNKTLTKEGLELKWEVQNFAPKEKVQVNYNLRRRVSRTIIFIIKNNLKIIKTHFNLNKLEFDGLYEAKLPLTNPFRTVLEGVIVEDIIPLYYLHYINEPTNLIPDKTTDLETGELFKWNIETMDAGTLNYHYKLLELNRFEKTKIDIDQLSKEGQDLIEKGKIIEALNKYKEIKNQLISSIK
ncbi:MAG: hypothetical protein ACFFDO_05300 [Candidatus Thorarchaeota archaeon]